jgi:hypothetical protein
MWLFRSSANLESENFFLNIDVITTLAHRSNSGGVQLTNF